MQHTIMSTKRCLLEIIKIMQNHTDMWDEAMMMAKYLRNMIYITSGNVLKNTPHEKLIGNNTDLSMLLVFGAK